MVRHVSKDGLVVKSEIIMDAKNPRAGAIKLADDYYLPRGETVDVLMLRDDVMLQYEVVRSSLDEGGVRVKHTRKDSFQDPRLR